LKVPDLQNYYVALSKQNHILIVKDSTGEWTLPNARLPKNDKHKSIKALFKDQFSLDIAAKRFFGQIEIEKGLPVTHFALCAYQSGLFKCSNKEYQQALWIMPEHILALARRGKMSLSAPLRSLLLKKPIPVVYPPHVVA
jgi:hypothetical protein